MSIALFMETLDTTIINTAIPAISNSLLISPIQLKLALISYFLSLAIFVPIGGWLADKYGAKTIFNAALILFVLGSWCCGISENLLTLIVSRSIQGIGGALTIPVGRLILFRIFNRTEFIGMMSKVAIIGALGAFVGPVLGGIISQNFFWGWIFWINIPVGIVTLIFAQLKLPVIEKQKVLPLNKINFIIFGASLAGLTYGFSMMSEAYYLFKWSIAIVVFSMLVLLFCISYSRKNPQPIIKFDLFRFRSFRISIIGNLISRLGFSGIPFLLPILLQVVMGYSSQVSGFLLTPWVVGVLVIKPFTVRLLRFFGYKRLLLINTLLLSCSIWSFILINQSSSYLFTGILIFIFGLLVTMQYGGMNTLAYSDIEEKHLSSATSMLSTLQQLAQSFGVALSAAVIQYYALDASGSLLLNFNVFHNTFFIMGIVLLVSALSYFYLTKEDGASMFKKPSNKEPLKA